MPDLMKTPSNRRYVVNFQHKEPINKYDIWLSFNKHEQGNQIIVDSEYLADKDLVFKIYMNGKWVPILGIPVSYEGIIQALEELDKKKMNIVPNFVDGHIPVFQQGSDECDQLIDGGTIEELVSNALTTIINGGGAIPLQRATTTQLGGVKAGLHIHNNNPDQYVEAKFKFPEGYDEGGIVENDRLYISASEIIQAINTYTGGGGSGLDLQLMGPSTRGGARANYVPVTWDAAHYIPVLVRTVDEMLYVNIDGIIEKIVALLESGDIEIYEAGEGIDITDNVISNILATYNTIGGIKAYTHDSQQDAVYGIQPKFGADGIWDVEDPTYNIDDEHLCITSVQIYKLLKKIDPTTQTFPIGTESGLYGRFVNIGTLLAPEYIPTLGINGVVAENVGKVPTVVPSLSSQTGYDIEWVNLSVGQYSPLTDQSQAGDECVVVAPQDKTGFLRGDGQFVPISNGSTVSWSQIWGSTGSKIAEITIDGVTTNIYAPNSIYYQGDGILIDGSNHISIDTTGARQGLVLGYNGANVEWVPQTSYTVGYGISHDDFVTYGKICGEITNNSVNSITASTGLDFTTTGARDSILLYVDGNQNSKSLYPYNYYEIILDLTGPATLNFSLEAQLTILKGNPVYALLYVTGKYNVIVTVTDSNSRPRLININQAVINGELNPAYSYFLITMQFGIVKIEPLENIQVINDNEEEPQEEP